MILCKSYKNKGINVPHYKEKTENKPLEYLSLKEGDILNIPLSQHLGAPAKPVIKKGSEVKKGQLIAESSAFISANIHSPVKGVVKSIDVAEHPLFGYVPSIKINVTSADDDLEPLGSSDKLTELIKDAGIVGLGGATFPTHVKLSPPKKIDTFIVNGAECEPYLTGDYRLLVEKSENIIKGALLIKDLLKAENFFVAIEDNKKKAIEIFKNLEQKYGFQLAVLESKYPQGGEKQLIKSVLDRVVPEGGLPLDIGVVVDNVATVNAVYEAYYLKKPLIERTVTVTGAVKEPKNLIVRLGTPIKALIDACGGFIGDAGKIIMGGPMMGLSVFSLETPVNKATSGIIVQNKSEVVDKKITNCIRCGKCVRVCPMDLKPLLMEQCIIAEQYERLKDLHLFNCIECGCCAYICPARRQLVANFKTGKVSLNKYLKDRNARK
ncbi:MAG: electron transport complex subunit RsxC [Deferribacterota bacterium]|nr:electron transport complex subunit RsxC [Deferribacterota bacterium]